MYVSNVLIQVDFILWPKQIIFFVRNMSKSPKRIHHYHTSRTILETLQEWEVNVLLPPWK